MRDSTTIIFNLLISVSFIGCGLTDSKPSQVSANIVDANPVISSFKGPRMGIIYDIEITDNDYLFASGNGNPGLLMQDKNTGLWKNLFADLSLSFETNKVQVLSNNVIIAGGEGGIYISQDGGKTWDNSLKDGDISFDEIHDIEESINGNVYVAISNSQYVNNNYTGLARSVDGGKNWTAISTPFKINDILLKDDTLFAAGNHGVLMSKNEGEAWETLLEKPSVAIDKDEKENIWVGSEYTVRRWDGLNWEVFEVAKFGFLKTLSVNSSQSVYYAYSEGGIYELDPTTGDNREIFPDLSPLMLETTKTNLYIGTNGNGALKISYNDLSNSANKIGIPPYTGPIKSDYQGNILVSLYNTSSTNNGLYWKEKKSSNWERISNGGNIFVTPNDGYFQFINPEVRHSMDYGQTWNISEINVLQDEQFLIDSYWVGENGSVKVLGRGVSNTTSKQLLKFEKSNWKIIGEIPRVDADEGSIIETEAGIFLSTRKGIMKITSELTDLEKVRSMNLEFAPQIIADDLGRLYTYNKEGDIIRSNQSVSEWETLVNGEENIGYFPEIVDSDRRVWIRGIKRDPVSGAVIERFYLVSSSDHKEFFRLGTDQWKLASHLSVTETPEGTLLVGTGNSGLQIIESFKN